MPEQESSQVLAPEDILLKGLREKLFGEALTNLITRKTPEDMVRLRPGRGQQQFRYVPVAWFIDQLNSLFSFDWDFSILDQGVEEKKHIWVKGRLIVRVHHDKEVVTITKEQYGGSEIKLVQSTQKMVDYADDLKAASSDCLKKCATLLGLAWDVYSGSREALTEAKPKTNQLLAFYKRGEEAGFDKEGLDAWFKQQIDINKEGRDPESAVEAEILGAFPKLVKLAKEQKDKENG